MAHEDFVDVQAAAIWWWVDRLDSASEAGWLFVGVDDEDVDAELLSRLRARYWQRPRYWKIRSWMAPRSLGIVDEERRVRHATSGESGTTLTVGHVEFSSPVAATAYVSTTGADTKVALGCDASGWRVREVVHSLPLCY